MLVAASELTMLMSALNLEAYRRGYQTIALKAIPDSSKLILCTTRAFYAKIQNLAIIFRFLLEYSDNYVLLYCNCEVANVRKST